MLSFTHRFVVSAPFLRSVAIATLMGGTILAAPLTAALAAPLTAARADTAANAPIQLVADKHAGKKGETVEHRITKLHQELKITADEESKWNDVAQAMRENAANMDKLIAATRTTPPQSMTAVDDLKAYEQIARAHVEGLKNLIASFGTLYNAMPDAQKKLADKVFAAAGHRH